MAQSEILMIFLLSQFPVMARDEVTATLIRMLGRLRSDMQITQQALDDSDAAHKVSGVAPGSGYHEMSYWMSVWKSTEARLLSERSAIEAEWGKDHLRNEPLPLSPEEEALERALTALKARIDNIEDVLRGPVSDGVRKLMEEGRKNDIAALALLRKALPEKRPKTFLSHDQGTESAAEPG